MHPDDRFMIVIAFMVAFIIGFLSASLGPYIGGMSTIVAFFAVYYTYKRIAKCLIVREVERRKKNES